MLRSQRPPHPFFHLMPRCAWAITQQSSSPLIAPSGPPCSASASPRHPDDTTALALLSSLPPTQVAPRGPLCPAPVWRAVHSSSRHTRRPLSLDARTHTHTHVCSHWAFADAINHLAHCPAPPLPDRVTPSLLARSLAPTARVDVTTACHHHHRLTPPWPWPHWANSAGCW